MEFARSEPQVIVGQAFSRHNSRYEPDDVRHVTTIDEDIENTENLTLAEVEEFHSAFYGASNAEVVVVGDFDPVAVRAAVEEFIDGWESPQTYAEVTYPYPDGGIEPISETFETPDKENAVFMAGMPLDTSDEHPDYPANYILGQGFNSRLISRIRGDEGLSYSVGSSFSAQAGVNGGRFVVNAIAAPQNATRVEASFRDELETILGEGYTAEEIAAAKEIWTQARQIRRTRDAALAGMLLTHEHNGRTMARDQELEAAIQALTGENIISAMRRHLDLDQMTFMMGGDFANATPDPE
jgi:zinc protease